MNQTIFEGDTFSLTCQATGRPIPSIRWYFNGIPMANTTDYVISEISLNPTTTNSTLTVICAQKSDMGTYRCDASNVVSTSSSSTTLIVHGKHFVCNLNTKL